MSDKKIHGFNEDVSQLEDGWAEFTPTASQLITTGKLKLAWCWLCRRVREVRVKNIYNLAVKTYGYINSAGCKGMATTVTAAYRFIWRHLYNSMHVAQKSKGKLKLVTLDQRFSVT